MEQHPYDSQMGPFYTGDEVDKVLGITGSQRVELRMEWKLLGVLTSDRVWLYPAFQFLWDGSLDLRLQEVLAAFKDSSIDGWAVVDLLTTPSRELDQTPLEWVRAGGELEPVVAIALDARWRWTRP